MFRITDAHTEFSSERFQGKYTLKVALEVCIGNCVGYTQS